MNQHQRKFLIEEIEKIYKRDRGKLLDRKPKAPSLNNYLVSAILENTAQLKPMEEIRAEIRNRVRDLGKGEALLETSSRWTGRDREETEGCIKLSAMTLFDVPAAFAEVKAKHEKEMEAWTAEMEALESSINAMRIKVQVGSDEALESLVNQADKLCQMSLSASSKLLIPSTTS